nr:MAG TPA: hypothetical protein [Caudoviricetes sp.]
MNPKTLSYMYLLCTYYTKEMNLQGTCTFTVHAV